jgi:hypothetical protein
MSHTSSEKPVTPINEEALDKMIELIEGPLNTAGEKILSSTIVLAPLSLALDLGFRLAARLRGDRQ